MVSAKVSQKITGLFALLFVMGIFALGGCAQADRTLSIATGGPAGLYYPFGGGMASVWSKQLDNVNVKAEVTGGSITNVTQVARLESDLGIAMADVTTDAFLGQGLFDQALPLRVLFTAYPNIVHILTLQESGINSVADLRGKRVALGAQGSGTAVAAANVLGGLGVSLDDVAPRYLSFAATTAAIKDGTVDAGFIVGGLGIAAVTELAVTRSLRLINLSDAELQQLVEQYPAYSGYRIPAETYSGVGKDTTALGIWSAVVVHENMPTELAYRLTCTVYQQRATLLQISPVVQAMTLENIHRLPAVPLHPGTQLYLQDPSAACDRAYE
jgi:TRAP transporter TAXI family solute receptor